MAVPFAALPAVMAWCGAMAGEPQRIARFPVAFTVASEGGEVAQTEAWIDAELSRAEELFAPHGVHFARAVRRVVEGHAAMVTRDDRDALSALLLPGVINVFVVRSLKDVDEADRFRFGVHWRPVNAKPKRYVILSAAAPVTVLAHELGHYFGLPHSQVEDNLMSYKRKSEDVFLDARQVAIVRATARAVIQSREVSGTR